MSWDDGKHTKVKRVLLTFDDVIRSIEVEYDGASVKSQRRGTVGTKSDGFTLSPDEYITEVNGYTKTVFSGDVITALTFKTNKKTYGTYGNKTRSYFSLNAPKDKQIAGFLGSSINALNSINAHFGPLPPPSGSGTNPAGTDESGGNHDGGAHTKPGTDDHGGNHDGGAHTKPGTDEDGGNHDGKTNTDSSPQKVEPQGGKGGNHDGGAHTKPGTDDHGGNHDGKTNTDSSPQKVEPQGGKGGNHDGGAHTKPGTDDHGGNHDGKTNTDSSPQKVEPQGGKGGNHDGGAHTKPGTDDHGGNHDGKTNTDSSPQKVEPQGGKGGNQWDDGADHDGVTKIHVTFGVAVEQIRFDYVKNRQPKEGAFRGIKGNRSFTYKLEVNHPDEYLLSVKGCYDVSSNIIKGIEFKTNTQTFNYIGYDEGTQFSLEVKDKKIIGFHGFADTHLNSLGAYFVPISTSSSSSVTPPPPPKKTEAQGGNYGEAFDDGAFDDVRKVYIGQGDSGVAYVKLEYEKGGKKETREHGKMTLLGTEEFEVDSDDYITSMDVYVDKLVGFKSDIVTALAFKTFKGKTAHPFGITSERKYEIKDANGGKLAGFHGCASDVLYAIGAYIAPKPN